MDDNIDALMGIRAVAAEVFGTLDTGRQIDRAYSHTHCSRGDEFAEENTGWGKRGTRRCLKCDALRARLKRAKGPARS
jgi:hypothetical protein